MGFTLSQIIVVTISFLAIIASIFYKLWRQRKIKRHLNRNIIYKVEHDVWE